jgi:3-isopropylmalate dehydrogenase
MMLAHLGWPKEETRIESICARAIETGNCTPDVGGTKGTKAVADWILSELKNNTD